jgi:hypothetical protein
VSFSPKCNRNAVDSYPRSKLQLKKPFYSNGSRYLGNKDGSCGGSFRVDMPASRKAPLRPQLVETNFMNKIGYPVWRQRSTSQPKFVRFTANS